MDCKKCFFHYFHPVLSLLNHLRAATNSFWTLNQICTKQKSEIVTELNRRQIRIRNVNHSNELNTTLAVLSSFVSSIFFYCHFVIVRSAHNSVSSRTSTSLADKMRKTREKKYKNSMKCVQRVKSIGILSSATINANEEIFRKITIFMYVYGFVVFGFQRQAFSANQLQPMQNTRWTHDSDEAGTYHPAVFWLLFSRFRFRLS